MVGQAKTLALHRPPKRNQKWFADILTCLKIVIFWLFEIKQAL